MIPIGNNAARLLKAIELVNNIVPGVNIPKNRTLLVAEAFLKTLIKVYGQHPVYSDKWKDLVSASM